MDVDRRDGYSRRRSGWPTPCRRLALGPHRGGRGRNVSYQYYCCHHHHEYYQYYYYYYYYYYDHYYYYYYYHYYYFEEDPAWAAGGKA